MVETHLYVRPLTHPGGHAHWQPAGLLKRSFSPEDPESTSFMRLDKIALAQHECVQNLSLQKGPTVIIERT